MLCLLTVSMTVFFFMCFADMAQTHHYSLVNQGNTKFPWSWVPVCLCGCSGGRQAGQGAAGTYFLQEWHSRSPGQPPPAWRWAGWAPRGAGSPHAARSRRTAAPLLSSIIQAVFPAWNEEKQWKISSLLPECSSQRRGWDMISTDPVHTQTHSHTPLPWHTVGSGCAPRTSLPSTWSLSSPVCQSLGAAVVSRQGSSSHSEHAPLLHPPSLIRVIAMEICYSNTEILELPSGEEDLKGPRCGGWSLLYSSSAPKGHALFLADTGCCHPYKRVLGNFCVCCCNSWGDCAEIHSSHPLLSCNSKGDFILWGIKWKDNSEVCLAKWSCRPAGLYFGEESIMVFV